MIYLICAQNSKRGFIELDSPKYVESPFFKYVMNITNHKNVLYPYSFYRNVTKKVIPNRVNVIFTTERKKNISVIINGIVVNSVKEILSTYSDKVDDVYIIATNNEIISRFGNYADYLIVYETDELGHPRQDITDLINFANYNILKTDIFEDHKVHYFVVNPDNFLGN